MKIIQNKINIFIPLIISIIFFILKFSGLDWGFPAILHNDESNVVRTSLGLRFGDFNPHHFDWPSLYFYLNYFFFWVFIKLRIQLQVIFGTENMQSIFPFWWGPELPFYYISRLITNLSLIISTVLIYFISLKIRPSKLFASLSSIIFSMGYITFYNGFYGLSDTTQTLFLLITFYFCMKIIDQNKIQYYIWAGIFTGLATSTKYHGALGGIIILITHIYINRHKFRSIFFDYKIYLAALTALLAFFITTPYAIIDHKTFFSKQDQVGAMWQIEHMGHAFNYHKHIFTYIPMNFGLLLSLTAIIGIFYLIKLRSKYSLILLSIVILFIMYVGSWAIARDHYALIYLPYLSILISLGIIFLKTKFNNDFLWAFILAILLIQPTTNITNEIIKRNKIDTRILAGQWIQENINQGSTILLSQNKTGYFGGTMPVFNYDNYVIYEKNLDNINPEKYYYVNRYKKEYKDDSVTCKIIFQIYNRDRTGNEIYIFECEKVYLE